MKNRVIISIAGSLLLIAITNGKVLNSLLSFLLVGVVPGTSYSVPYWLMMALYCVGITILITYAVEKIYSVRHNIKKSHAKPRPARRTYSHS